MMPSSNQGVGMNMGFPDVCGTPTPVGPVPIPYPNIGMNAMSVPTCPNILVSGMPGHNMLDKPLMTNGDNAGVAHPMCMMPGGCTVGNPFVMMNGLPSEHLLCPSNGNNFNNPIGVKAVPSIVNVLVCAMPAGAIAGTAAAVTGYGREAVGAEAATLVADLLDWPERPMTLGLTVVGSGEAGHDERWIVAHVRRRGMARQIGVRRGDELLAIDGVPMLAVSNSWADYEIDPTATIAVRRDGATLDLVADDPETLAMTLRRMPNVAITHRGANGGVGAIAVDVFNVDTADDVADAMAELAAAGVGRVVLDLRFSPGGTMDAVVELAALFLPLGSLVAWAEGDSARMEWRTASPPIFSGPLAIAVDAETASAAEVFAAAMQAHQRAVIVGEPTFGKGWAQRIMAVPADAHAARLDTVATMRAPTGAPIFPHGVCPDIATASSSISAAIAALA